MNERIIEKLKYCLKYEKKITFLVGAGLSAESGIPTFRGKDSVFSHAFTLRRIIKNILKM